MVMEMILRKFVSKAQGTMSQLAHSSEALDATEVARLGHDLKGSALNVAACRLGGVVAEMETKARAGQTAEFSGFCTRIERKLTDLEQAVEILLNDRRILSTQS